jgi:peptide chain release factor 2
MSAQPNFWQEPMKAQGTMQQLSALREDVHRWREMEQRVGELAELVALAIEEGDISLRHEVQSEIEQVTSRLQKLRFQLLFGGEYDKRDAILAIHAGAGGTESQDWADMLLRMYLRWAERRNYEAEVLDVSPGEEAGIKSAIVEVRGNYAYGYLKSEHGVHRLVRLSPFDADHARHTSFVMLEVLPEVEQDIEVKIGPEELKIDTFGSSGPGGQHMQKTSTAVRLTHLPSGIVVTCQGERSQFQNKNTALKILQARLLELELTKRAEEKTKLKGEHLAAGWGNQIRSYVLHPYKMVKDHRTGYETSDPTAVLDGELDELMKAYLDLRVKSGT